jgi:hypothetical protein
MYAISCHFPANFSSWFLGFGTKTLLTTHTQEPMRQISLVQFGLQSHSILFILVSLTSVRGIAFCNVPVHLQRSIAKSASSFRPLVPKNIDPPPPKRQSARKDLIAPTWDNKDAKLIFHRAWFLQTEKSNYMEASLAYIEALKLDPQRARELSMSRWSETWGSQNIRGYPSKCL